MLSTAIGVNANASKNEEDGEQKKYGRRGLSDGCTESVRYVMHRILRRDFHGNKSALARALDQSPSNVGALLEGRSRPGIETIEALVALEGGTWERVLMADMSAPVGPQFSVDGAPLADLKGLSVDHPAPATSAPPSPDERAGKMAAQAIWWHERNARFPRLEATLVYYAHEPGRWSEATIGLARTGRLGAACDHWSGPQWTAALDAIERVSYDDATDHPAAMDLAKSGQMRARMSPKAPVLPPKRLR